MHTKDKIMDSLEVLTNDYDPIIKNPNYRGSMEKYVFFTVKQIAEKIGMTPATIRKWCHVLNDADVLVLRWKRCYSANDSMTMEFRRSDAPIIKLKPFKWEGN